MRVFGSAFSLFMTGAIGSSCGLSIRGSTKSADKLMAFARRLDDNNYNYNGGGNYYGQGAANYGYAGQYGNMNDESLYFLGGYSMKLLNCIQGEQVINYENGEMESSTVIFRLCPYDTCDIESKMGCDSGYGDYAVGINTFLRVYMEQQQEYNQNYGYDMIVYNQYGQEFNAVEYLEAGCKEYNIEEAQNNQQGQNYQYQQYNSGNNGNGGRSLFNNYYNNGGYSNNYYQNTQFFIGPGCSEAGTTIALGIYMDEYCSYPSEVSFSDIAYGWDSGLPFLDGGLINMNCVSCYEPDDDYYNYQPNQMCVETYQSTTSRCEENMESHAYYGQSTQGCTYLSNKINSVYGGSSISDWFYGDSSNSTETISSSTSFMNGLSTKEVRAIISAMVLFCLSIAFGVMLVSCLCVKKTKQSKRLKAVSDEKADGLMPGTGSDSKRRTSVVALVRSTTNNMAQSVRSVARSTTKSVKQSAKTAAVGVKLVLATAPSKSVSGSKKEPQAGNVETVDEYNDEYKKMNDDNGIMLNFIQIDETSSLGVKSHKSTKNRMSSIAAKTVASVKSIASSKKSKGIVDEVSSIAKSEYKAPGQIAEETPHAASAADPLLSSSDASTEPFPPEKFIVEDMAAVPLTVVDPLAEDEKSIKSGISTAQSVKSLARSIKSMLSKKKTSNDTIQPITEEILIPGDVSKKSIERSVKSSAAPSALEPLAVVATADDVAAAATTTVTAVPIREDEDSTKNEESILVLSAKSDKSKSVKSNVEIAPAKFLEQSVIIADEAMEYEKEAAEPIVEQDSSEPVPVKIEDPDPKPVQEESVTDPIVEESVTKLALATESAPALVPATATESELESEPKRNPVSLLEPAVQAPVSSSKLTTEPVIVPAAKKETKKYEADMLDWVFGACSGDNARNVTLSLDEASIPADLLKTDSALIDTEQEPALAEHVAQEQAEVQSKSPTSPVAEVSPEEKIVADERDEAVAETERMGSVKVTKDKDKNIEVSTNTSLENKSMVSKKSTSQHSEKTEKTKGSSGRFLSKMDSHLKKKVTRSSSSSSSKKR